MKCLVVVAHPDDETIWMGGMILRHPEWDWQIVSLSRADDSDRAPRFHIAAEKIGADAYISDLDDSPELAGLSSDLHEIKDRILEIVPREYDLVFTHGEKGEYTRHQRHEQVHRAVREMVDSEDITGDLRFFAYDDCDGECQPHPSEEADIVLELSSEVFQKKQKIVRDIYGFGPGSFEYEACGPAEGFKVYRR